MSNMGDRNKCCLLFFLVFFSILQNNMSSGWFFSSKDDSRQFSDERYAISGDFHSEFSLEIPNNRKGIELTENAKRMIDLKISCYQMAYQNLLLSCSKSLADEEKRSRFAWDLSDCFQKDSGKSPLPRCDRSWSMLKCRKELDSDTNKIFLEFYLVTDHICRNLQSEAFRRHIERLVNELKNSAQITKDKLYELATNTQDLLRNSHQIQDSLESIDDHTKQLAEIIQNVENRIDLVLKTSEEIYKNSQEISASQLELQNSQTMMSENIEATMENIEKSQREVGKEIENLKNQTAQIENQVNKLGDKMLAKMMALQNKADDISSIVGVSLENQKQLLDGQSQAIEGLKFLTQFQSQALEESRGSMLELATLGSQQQQELLTRQEQLQRTHDRLAESSKTILAAQETFESKQANMFIVLDKLFALHKAMLLESRGLKSIFIYFLSMFALYMLTSTKQTYAVRPRLYIGLCAAFFIEFTITRSVAIDIEQHAWITSTVRSLVVVLTSIQLLHSIYAYRDYEVLNHNMLLKLNDKLNEKINKMGQKEEDLWETDDDIDWSTWIDADIADDLNSYEDPDYLLPEEIGENSSSSAITTNRYNLRSQRYISYSQC